MRQPDFVGIAGKMWRVALPTVHKRPDTTATLGVWLLTVPGAHPLWHSYLLSIVHLRDILDVPPASKHYPEAEYEMALFALDPQIPLPDPDDSEHFHPKFLTPANLIEQFHGVTDEQATQTVELLGRAFVDGIANPDTDYRSMTKAIFHKSIEHVALGGHPIPE